MPITISLQLNGLNAGEIGPTSNAAAFDGLFAVDHFIMKHFLMATVEEYSLIFKSFLNLIAFEARSSSSIDISYEKILMAR